MSEVEKKVVSVEFDNRKFDKNVKKSSKAFDEFKEKLQVKDVSKSFDVVIKRLTSLDIVAASIINNLTTRVVNLGVQLVKSLSVDNISSGWDKFGLKTTSVATIAAQNIKIAGKELTNYEEKLEAINTQLDKLNWYTDETSYNFTDMVNTIGKFTAAGQDLDKSVNAMIGIANWAALSGQNASVASRAMYQLAQAMSKGNIQLIDWRSIETANMATMEFKQTVLDTAAAMGELTKQGENYISKTGKKITAISFSESLADKWFTSDILVATLEKYSAAVERVYELSEETGLTASEVMARYSSELDKFGLKAFKAAQEARTFADAINSIKDAVSTGWLNTFEKIFGGYDESRKLWTDLANELYEVFAEGGNFRNQILGLWNDLGGRSDLFRHGKEGKQGAFWNIYDSIVEVTKKIKEVRDEVFAVTIFQDMDDKAKDLAYQLKNITDNMQRFTEKILTAVKENKSFQGVLKGVFSILKTIGQVMRGIRYALDPIITLITGVFSDVMDRIGAFGSNLSVLERTFKTIENVASVINVLLDSLLNILNIRGNLNALFDFIASIFGGTFDAASAGRGIAEFFSNLGESLKGFKNTVVSVVKGAKDSDVFGPLYDLIKGIVEFAKGIWAIIAPAISIVGKTFEVIGVVLQVVGNFIKDIIDNGINWKRLGVIGGVILSIGVAFGFFIMIYNLFYSIRNILSPLHQICEDLGDSALKFANSSLFKGLSAIILNIGKSLLMIAAAFAIIGSMDTTSFTKAAITIGVLIVLLGGIIIAVTIFTKTVEQTATVSEAMLGSVNGFFIKMKQTVTQGSTDIIDAFKKSVDYALKLNAMADMVYAIGTAMVAVGIAFRLIGTLELDQWSRAMIAMGAFMVLVTGMMFVAKKTDNDIDNKSIKKFGKSLLAFALSFKIIAGVLVKLSSIKTDKLWIAFGAFAAIASVFVGMVVLMALINNKLTQYSVVTKDTKIVKVANSVSAIMASLLVALITVSTMIAIFGNMDRTALMQGGIAVAGILVVIGGVFALISNMKSYGRGDDVLKMLLSLSTALIAFGITMLMIKDIAWEQILAAAGSMSMLMLVTFVIIGVVSNGTSDIKKALPALALLGGLASIMVAFGAAMLLIKDVPWKQILTAAGAMAAVIAVLFGAMALLKVLNVDAQLVLSVGAAMTLFAASMFIMAESIKSLAEIPWQSMLPALVVAIASFGLLIATTALIKKLGSAEILLSVGASLLMLSAALLLIGASMQVISMALVPFIQAIQDSFIVLFDSMENMTEVMKLKADVITGFFDQLGIIIFKIFTDMFANLINAVAVMVTKFSEAFSKMRDPIIQILNDFYEIIKQTLPNLLEIIGMIFESILDFFYNNEEKIVGGIVKLLVDVAVMLAEAAPKLAKALGETLSAFIFGALDWLITNVGDLLEKLWELLMTLMWGLLKMLRAHAREFGDWLGAFIREVFIAAIQALWAFLGQFISTIVSIFSKGAGQKVKNWFDDIGDDMEEFINDAFEINSPSKMTQRTGEYLMQGLVVGMENEKKETLNTATEIMADCVGTAIETAQDIIDEEDDALVIKPVLDLTNVESGAHTLAGIMSGVGGSSISADIASKTSADINRSRNQNGDLAATTTVNNAGDTYNNVFNITTNDPEEFAQEVDEIMQRQHYRNNLAKGGVR